MSGTVDARGLSCPQPVLDTLEMIAKVGGGELLVLVDTEASKENVARAVRNKGWTVTNLVEKSGEYHLTISSE
jgi:tRNA 2-thiouridine synthesizing protein A